MYHYITTYYITFVLYVCSCVCVFSACLPAHAHPLTHPPTHVMYASPGSVMIAARNWVMSTRHFFMHREISIYLITGTIGTAKAKHRMWWEWKALSGAGQIQEERDSSRDIGDSGACQARDSQQLEWGGDLTLGTVQKAQKVSTPGTCR